MKFQTKAIHAGQEPNPGTGAVITPVYQTSTYRQKAVGQHQGFEYSPLGQPHAPGIGNRPGHFGRG